MAGRARPHAGQPRFGGGGSFSTRLAFGPGGEGLVERWLRARGHIVLRTCDLPAGEVGGPTIVTPSGDPLPVPDLLALKDGVARWVEAKRKTSATLHRRSNTWCTGIAEYELDAYMAAEAATQLPVLLVFHHLRGQSPLGLLGHTLERLREREHHRHGGMVFWATSDLPHLATSDELEALPP